MIESCNFKHIIDTGLFSKNIEIKCILSIRDSSTSGTLFYKSCVNEENCVIYQTYKLLYNKQ